MILLLFFLAPTSLVFALLVLMGILIRTALALLTVIPVFYTEKANAGEYGFWAVTSWARYPLDVYPRKLAWFFSFVLPIGMMKIKSSSQPSSKLIKFF